tara:strand:+ start:28703 stop:28972 length:270 start_codon:yes stop_codon:yes gene_type:complete
MKNISIEAVVTIHRTLDVNTTLEDLAGVINGGSSNPINLESLSKEELNELILENLWLIDNECSFGGQGWDHHDEAVENHIIETIVLTTK